MDLERICRFAVLIRHYRPTQLLKIDIYSKTGAVRLGNIYMYTRTEVLRVLRVVFFLRLEFGTFLPSLIADGTYARARIAK